MRDLNGTQVKACSQNWTLVKTIEEELTKMREKMEKNLEQGLQKISSEQLTKDVTIDMNQLVDMCNATKGTTDNLSKELSRLQKSMKGLYLVMIKIFVHQFLLIERNYLISCSQDPATNSVSNNPEFSRFLLCGQKGFYHKSKCQIENLGNCKYIRILKFLC